ncbi:patatin-like phospholipase family protein [Prosthecomicrobium sp. N25]|uniref:patatin-like phospholipase family protein n=1 Tax=Prosthecomicrobium sp. N25 TaxID=3129254 RepID=UPI0030780535
MSDVHGARMPPSATMKWQSTVDAAKPKHSMFAFLKREPTRSQAQLQEARSQFKEHFSTSVAKLGAELQLTPAMQRNLERAGAKALDKIVNDTFAQPELAGKKMSRADFNAAVHTANVKSLQKMVQFTTIYGKPDTTPHVTPLKTADGQIKLVVTKPAPPIENLILRGGGAKGIGNSAALVELEKSGALSDLKQIVGTSAGALTAVGLACGMSAETFAEFSKNTDINGLKGTPSNFKECYPMVSMGHRVGHTAGTALRTLDEVSSMRAYDKLDQNWDTVVQAHADGTLSDAEFARMEILKEPPNFEANRTDKMVTFGDLRAMAKIFPDIKELTLTGMNRSDSQLAYFNADTAPDMPIAVAGRISMSIPLYFASVDFNGKTWVDGGVGSNMPSNAILQPFKDKVATAQAEMDDAVKSRDAGRIELAGKALAEATRDLEQANSKTLLMTFDDGGKAYKKMHDPEAPPKTKPGFIDKLVGRIAGDKNFALNKQQDTQNVRDAGPNVIVVHHGSIGTLDLDASEKRIGQATLESQMRALEFVAARQDQAVQEVYTSVDQVVASLSPQERQQMLDAGPPTLGQFQNDRRSDGDARQLFASAMAVYDKVNELVNGRQAGVLIGS